jgi:hypothetical protein
MMNWPNPSCFRLGFQTERRDTRVSLAAGIAASGVSPGRSFNLLARAELTFERNLLRVAKWKQN